MEKKITDIYVNETYYKTADFRINIVGRCDLDDFAEQNGFWMSTTTFTMKPDLRLGFHVAIYPQERAMKAYIDSVIADKDKYGTGPGSE